MLSSRPPSGLGRVEAETTHLAAEPRRSSGSFRSPVPSGAPSWAHAVDASTTLPPVSAAALREAAAPGPGGVSTLPGPRTRRRRTILLAAAALGLAVAGCFGVVALRPHLAGPAVLAPSPAAAEPVTGRVHDSGAHGVALRSAPTTSAVSQGSMPDGSVLTVVCGQIGEPVADGRRPVSLSSSTWLRTSGGIYVSLLYVRVARSTVASCQTGEPEISTLPTAQRAATTDGSGGSRPEGR